jgi:two-component system, cell cycle sensor histidine kinase and response regulator CckA
MDGRQRKSLDPLSAAARRPRGRGRAIRAAGFRALVEDSEDGMILADPQGRILYANAACERYLGYRPAELVGRIGFELCRPEHEARAREAFGYCLAHPGEPVRTTVDATTRNGDVRGLAVTLVNRIPTPGVQAIVVQVRDPAAFHAADAGPEAYRLLFEHAPIGLGVADMEGNLLAVNDAMLQPGGYSREDIRRIGSVARLYAAAADRERILDVARRKGLVWREEVRFLRKDGSAYEALLSLSPIRFAGRPCWYAAVEDITDHKRAEARREQLEAELRQAQKMEAVGRMTGGVAHDFNNILSVILANAELLAAALDPGQPDVSRDLAELRRAAQRGAVMIRKLLGFSRKVDLTIAPTDLGELVHRLHGMLRHVIPEHIVLEEEAEQDCVALCDAGAVEQMVLNLATNARDAMPAGGTVRIVVSPAVVQPGADVRPPWLAPGDFVRLSVADTGEGMDEGVRARVLEPFFTTKPPGVGTGLGLSMVYGLVKQQHGFIDIQSAPGQGTTVHLYFPRGTTPARAPRTTPSSTRAREGGATVLLIEDDESLQRTGRRVLEHLGYRVLVAGDGSEGLAMFRTHRTEIDLVMSDMVMPGLTGAQVYEAIRREQPGVRFLLSSGYQERADRIVEVPEGLRVVPKPWTIEELARTVRETLDAAS